MEITEIQKYIDAGVQSRLIENGAILYSNFRKENSIS